MARERKTKKPLVITIAGGSGAGKSWLARELVRRLGSDAVLVSVDNFYLDRAHLSPARRARLNFDQPKAIEWSLLVNVLRRLAGGKTAQIPVYDFATHTRQTAGRKVAAKPVIVIEGLWPLTRADLRALSHIAVFVECPTALRLERRRSRDIASRGRTAESVEKQFWEVVEPMHQRFVEPQRKYADVVCTPESIRSTLSRLVREVKVACLNYSGRSAIG